MNVHKNFINPKKPRHRVRKLYIKDLTYKYEILRPLINASRFELLKFCDFWNLPIFPDFTNFNISLRRNRLRLQFLPYLKFFFNFQIFKKVNQIQIILNFENKYFQKIIQKLFYCKNENFKYFPKILQYRIFHYFFYFMKKKISFNEISSFFDLIFK